MTWVCQSRCGCKTPNSSASANANCHIPARAPTTSWAQLYRRVILSSLGHDHAFTNFPVGHPSWDCSCANLLNFRVSIEPEASELSKGLVLGRDENIHIRLIGSSPLSDVGCDTNTNADTDADANANANSNFGTNNQKIQFTLSTTSLEWSSIQAFQ
ncbi:hypothetical protein DVH24_022628 [Malus domestica]|uniref:Uncharacterized protein n=1 Tax=Malus domestica TaxID=3750 RepID=A0A498KPW3_MALDO|nr:hypothetical protein DVH24_022628 [Malus domestica]